MTATASLLLLVTAWVCVGLVTAWVMARHGHHFLSWALLGVVLGPIVMPLAMDARWRAEPLSGQPIARAAGTRGPGSVDVVIGIDGSAASTGALRNALGLLGPRLGRLSLAFVTNADRADSDQAIGKVALEQAARIAHMTAGAGALEPDLVLLAGAPAEALRRFAEREDFDVIVVGPRGSGGSRLLLGSTAGALVRTGGVPVLVSGAPEALRLDPDDDDHEPAGNDVSTNLDPEAEVANLPGEDDRNGPRLRTGR